VQIGEEQIENRYLQKMSSEIDGDGKALLRKQVRARPALLRQLAGGGKTLGEQINYAGRATDFEQAARPSMAEHTVERGEASRATVSVRPSEYCFFGSLCSGTCLGL